MHHRDLIAHACAQVHPKQLKDGVIGDVGAALVTTTGHIYTGRCILTGSNTICAERVAIARMVSEGNEYTIAQIVAVWRDEHGRVYVIPPCGHCRQAMHDIDPQNIRITQVILSHDRVVPLATLLPYHDWW
ncbi:MAG: cytidine deaminase [Chloroflexi bacterium]|nr:cytidine deaminase [Chloroflexota bacterium]